MTPNPLFILEAIVGFGALVFVHELGHFLAAKWMGVRVEAFSLGFGPSLKKKWGETEYRLGICPVGGYVKMAGEEPTPEKPPQPGDFYSKTVGQRAVVFGAGVFMNLVFGFIAFLLAYQIGVPAVPAIVGGVVPGSPAWKAGLQRGDRIESIQGVSPPIDFEDLRTAIMLSSPGEGIKLTADRNGRTFEGVLYPKYEKELGMPSAGILDPETMTLAAPSSLPQTRADEVDFMRLYQAGLKAGDVTTALQLAGEEKQIPVATPEDFSNALVDCEGKPVRVFYRRGKNPAEQSVTVQPQSVGLARFSGMTYFGTNGVSAVRAGSWAEKAGLLPGDVILSVAGWPVRSRSEAIQALENPGSAPMPIQLVVRRGGEEKHLTVSLPPHAKVEACIAFERSLSVVDGLWRGYPAERAGIQPGDEIVAANDIKVNSSEDLAKIEEKAAGGSITISWRREGKLMSAQLNLQKKWEIGLPLAPGPRVIVRASLPKACLLSARKSYQWVVRSYASLRSLIRGSVSLEHLNGFIAIAYLTYGAAKRGLGMLLYLLGLLNCLLGVMNLLPIPVLDGGHLMFAAIEKVRGRAVNERARAIASYAGLALLVSLVALTFWNDIRLLLGV